MDNRKGLYKDCCMAKVVVVGTGVGGLAAALELRSGGHDVVVVERSTQPGGKAGSVKVGDVDVTGPDKQGNYLVLQKLAHDSGHRLSLK